MRVGEWSRSRFWHSYFLNSRHVRPRVPWSRPPEAPDPSVAAALPWLEKMVNRAGLARAWVVRRAADQYAADPAYVQCLRLIIREQQHHRELVSRLGGRFGLTPSPVRAPGKDMAKLLGVRFRLSLQLMSDLVDLRMLEALATAARDPALRTVCTTLLRERQMHVAFVAERLAEEFADFLFLRRNLRRWRVRAMFTALLVTRCREQSELMRVLGLAPTTWMTQLWRHFATVLEQMVPFHRDALIRLLTAQRERPYDRPESLNL